MSLKNIKDGWMNYIKSLNKRFPLDPELRELVEHRSEICAVCPEMQLMKRKVGKGPAGKCKKCGCRFPAMVFAPDKKCPIKKW